MKQELWKEERVKKLNPVDATRYRAITARGIYLAQDRSDIQYAVKEISRHQQNPTNENWEAIKRFGRYLVGKTRYTTEYKYQRNPGKMICYTDTDFAGCRITRKSTSGGVIMHGEHVIKTWSSNQAVIALSSGEAEYYGIVRGATHAIGYKSLLYDMGVHPATISVRTDATAAIGIANRRGCGQIWHIDTR